jgi:5-methylcytosine-specific restriction endonuclease McrA
VSLDNATLVLNRNWTPVDITSVLNALVKVYDGSARVVKPDDYSVHDFDSWASISVAEGEACVRTATLEIAIPEVIVLQRYSGVPNRGVAFSRANLHRRDRYTCQYCSARPGSEELTIDHVTPRSRGGISSWDNCVVACVKCNFKKANRTPAEAGVKLLKKPCKPDWTPRMVLARIPYKASWEKFVTDAYWNVELKS